MSIRKTRPPTGVSKNPAQNAYDAADFHKKATNMGSAAQVQPTKNRPSNSQFRR